MKALISKIEFRETGFRVAQVEPDDRTFETTPDFEWVDCADDVVADMYWYDPADSTIKPVPEPVVEEQPQPTNQGAQTL